MRLKPLYFTFLIIFIIFTGCSSKNANPLNVTIEHQEHTSSNDEQFDEELFDEFEDEIQTKDVTDPFSGYNRFMTNFNDKLFINVLIPISKGYNAVFHYEIRKSADNFFNNLFYPTRVVNNIFQGKFKNSVEETGRFIINSTIGILGLFDPAKSFFDLDPHKEDFGQTLGFYGVGGGPHIVLPFFGPSNLRDTISIAPDSFLSPIDYEPRDWITLTKTWESFLAIKAYEFTNKFSLNIDKYDKLKEDSIDLYPYFRDVYEQFRDKQIKE